MQIVNNLHINYIIVFVHIDLYFAFSSQLEKDQNSIANSHVDLIVKEFYSVAGCCITGTPVRIL